MLQLQKNHNELTIMEAYVHNFNKFKKGVAVIKTDENKNIKVPLLSNWKFDRRIKKWICQYKVWNMEGVENFKSFYERNKSKIIHGHKNILDAVIRINKVKQKNMKEYRNRLKNQKEKTNNREIEL